MCTLYHGVSSKHYFKLPLSIITCFFPICFAIFSPLGNSEISVSDNRETSHGLLHPRSIPGGGSLGRRGRSAHRIQAQRALHRNGCHLADPQSKPQASNIWLLHVSCLQDADTCRSVQCLLCCISNRSSMHPCLWNIFTLPSVHSSVRVHLG